LVKYDRMAASRTLLGQVGEGYAVTPGGRTISAHAAERIALGAPGRPPTTLARVDDILNNPTGMKYDPVRDTVKVMQGGLCGRKWHRPPAHRDGDGAMTISDRLQTAAYRILQGDVSVAAAQDLESVLLDEHLDDDRAVGLLEGLALYSPGSGSPHVDAAELRKLIEFTLREFALADGEP
jgi:hypothetical protein